MESTSKTHFELINVMCCARARFSIGFQYRFSIDTKKPKIGWCGPLFIGVSFFLNKRDDIKVKTVQKFD